MQGTVGFGVNLIAVPVVAVAAPGAVPGAMVLLSLPLTVTMAAREHDAIDRPGVLWIVVGRVPGTIVGVAVVALVSNAVLAAVVGGMILLGVLLSIVHPPVPVTRGTACAAGVVGGITGTAAAVEGPPYALLYQHAHGRRLRSTLAACFAIGTVMSAAALGLGGQITSEQLLLTAALLPALLAGLALSTLAARRVDAGRLRPFVLGLAAVAGVVAVVEGLGGF